MNIPDEAIEAVKPVLRDEGLDEKGGNPHSWRCEFPDLYPNHCTCVDDLARAVLEAAAPLLMAQALREAHSWAEEQHPWIGLMDLKEHIAARADELEGKP